MAPEINLLRTQSPLTGTVVQIADKLRTAAVVAASVTILLAMIAGFAYWALSTQRARLNDQKVSLAANISRQSQMEAALIALQSRLTTVEKVRAQSKSWDETLILVSQIVQSGTLTNAGVDEAGRLTMTVEVDSLSGALQVIAQVRVFSQEGRLTSSVLESFQFEEGGIIQLSVSFIVSI